MAGQLWANPSDLPSFHGCCCKPQSDGRHSGCRKKHHNLEPWQSERAGKFAVRFWVSPGGVDFERPAEVSWWQTRPRQLANLPRSPWGPDRIAAPPAAVDSAILAEHAGRRESDLRTEMAGLPETPGRLAVTGQVVRGNEVAPGAHRVLQHATPGLLPPAAIYVDSGLMFEGFVLVYLLQVEHTKTQPAPCSPDIESSETCREPFLPSPSPEIFHAWYFEFATRRHPVPMPAQCQPKRCGPHFWVA
jgi:hypothetical protein